MWYAVVEVNLITEMAIDNWTVRIKGEKM